ncbi:MAG: dioxygenase [Deltaproteobacteria bacterium]|nr:dioxygenase [Deltaproteobacteria bacterium]
MFRTHRKLFLTSVIMGIILFSAYGQNLLCSSPSPGRDDLSIDTSDPSSNLELLSLDSVPASCPGIYTVEETEGPYYKKGSPERSNLIEDGVAGEIFTLTGYVFDKDCKPIAGAWLDFWQADGNGVYDNAGFRLRGHQYTDENGLYVLKTVLPGVYPGRTNHIHVKVSKKAGGPAITSQLFFPEGKLNASDRIYHESLLVKMGKNSNGQNIGFFNFRLNQ